MPNVTIARDLQCDNSQFINPDRTALDLGGASVVSLKWL